MIIDGKKIAETLRQKLKKEIIEIKSSFKSVPGLTVILIGEDPASKIYVKNKEKFSKEIGINSEVIKYPENIEEKEVLSKIIELNKNKKVSGILVQLPLPKHINKQKVIETILPEKDVDGFHPINVGNLSSGYDSKIPCTPLGCFLLLKAPAIFKIWTLKPSTPSKTMIYALPILTLKALYCTKKLFVGTLSLQTNGMM